MLRWRSSQHPGGLGQIPGIRHEVPGLAGSTGWGNFWYNLPYWVAWFLNDLGKAAVLLVPFLFIVIYNRYGREKQFTVPAYLSTVPNPALKPWQVNLLFKDAAIEFDQDGFYATLLDLHRRKTDRDDGKNRREGDRDPGALVRHNRSLRTAGHSALSSSSPKTAYWIPRRSVNWRGSAQSDYAAEEKAVRFQPCLRILPPVRMQPSP